MPEVMDKAMANSWTCLNGQSHEPPEQPRSAPTSLERTTGFEPATPTLAKKRFLARAPDLRRWSDLLGEQRVLFSCNPVTSRRLPVVDGTPTGPLGASNGPGSVTDTYDMNADRSGVPSLLTSQTLFGDGLTPSSSASGTGPEREPGTSSLPGRPDRSNEPCHRADVFLTNGRAGLDRRLRPTTARSKSGPA